MEVIDLTLTKEDPTSKVCYLKPVSTRSHLIIKSDLDIKDETFLNFKSANGKEVKNVLNKNGLNRRISIPDWAGMIYMESEHLQEDITFNICVGY